MGEEQQGGTGRKATAEFPSKSGVNIDETQRLKFARQVLLGLAFICIGVFIAYGWYPHNTALQAMFELIKIGALPLVALVISLLISRAPSDKRH